MISLRLTTAPVTILCLGAHCDDIEIGCGGTLLTLLAGNRSARLTWVVFSADDVRETESRRAASELCDGVAFQMQVHRHRDGYFPYEGAEIKDRFESIKRDVVPDLIFTHRLDDRHQDHRTIAELTWNTFRDHTILEYEIPKYEGDLGHPGVYVPINRSVMESKVNAIITHFRSQAGKAWFTPETFWSLARLRGIECNSPSGYAEAFHARKLTIGLNDE